MLLHTFCKDGVSYSYFNNIRSILLSYTNFPRDNNSMGHMWAVIAIQCINNTIEKYGAEWLMPAAKGLANISSVSTAVNSSPPVVLVIAASTKGQLTILPCVVCTNV